MEHSIPLLIGMAFILGIRHGFDLDHLATIDAIARIVSTKRLLAQWTGFLFSLGHGLVVICISLIIGNGFKPLHIPSWLDWLGAGISLVFLFLFGILNLCTIFQDSHRHSIPIGIRNYLSQKLAGKNINAPIIVSIGALFALSFDTISQVVLFSLSAQALAGLTLSGILGVVFMLGMMLSDGLNGLFVSTLIQYADKASLWFSRLAGFIIASFSLIIGIINSIQLWTKNFG